VDQLPKFEADDGIRTRDPHLGNIFRPTYSPGEVGRELGEAGGPLVVGATTVMSLAAGFGARAVAMVLAAGASLWLHQAVESGDLSSNDSDHDSDHMESDDT
jgi:hypothetical protein